MNSMNTRTPARGGDRMNRMNTGTPLRYDLTGMNNMNTSTLVRYGLVVTEWVRKQVKDRIRDNATSVPGEDCGPRLTP